MRLIAETPHLDSGDTIRGRAGAAVFDCRDSFYARRSCNLVLVAFALCGFGRGCHAIVYCRFYLARLWDLPAADQTSGVVPGGLAGTKKFLTHEGAQLACRQVIRNALFGQGLICRALGSYPETPFG